MVEWKKICKFFLFPPIVVCLIFLPVATVFLGYAMLFLPAETPLSIAAYVFSAYTLTIWCVRLPRIIVFAKTFKNGNRYAKKWLDDTRLRVNVSLFGGVLWNTAYGALLLGLGLYHASFWYCSMAGYYILLAVMRFFLSRHTRRYAPGEQMRVELLKYRTCGWVFLAINLALSMMIFFMVYWNRSFYHHEITTIAMAAYTFAAFTMAIINLVKYRKYQSPVFSASKAISLAAACVSMLTLESTMLTTFGDGTTDLFTRRMLLGISGGVISIFVIAMALYMIVRSTKELRKAKINNS